MEIQLILGFFTIAASDKEVLLMKLLEIAHIGNQSLKIVRWQKMTNNDVATMIKRLQGRTDKQGKVLRDVADKSDKLEQRLRNTEQAQARMSKVLAARRRRLVAWSLFLVIMLGIGVVLGFATA